EGHQAGDLILQEFALLLKNTSLNATIGRYGGDEFIVLLDNADKYKAKMEAEKIRKKIETEFKLINITVSIGIAEFPTDATVMPELISEADEVLYRAKEFGGNRIAIWKEVEFNYKEDTKITQVNCVGDFNRWNKNLGLMKYNSETNKWQIKLRLKPGKYRYKFLIDGTKWIADPQAAEFTGDGFGGECSVITVTGE
ncbi:MAG: diguanylate cyclase, partial [Elusimicrobiota bacterium]|nr:diguanylate cyclase [Elusimicrobiota bacterium]